MSLFSPEQTDEEVLSTVIAHYFTPEELAAARELARAESYETAIASLSKIGHQSLRDSAEERPPRVFITIPGGKIIVHHPARLFPAPALYTFSVTHLALQALPPPEPLLTPTVSEARCAPIIRKTTQLLLFDGRGTLQPPQSAGHRPGNTPPKRPRPCVFVEQQVRIGTKKLFWTRVGWAVKKGYLGYVATGLPSGMHRVELIHLPSYWAIAAIYVDVLDAATHAQVQQWVADAHALTDLSRGITAILTEKTGKEKRWAWTSQLQELWYASQREPQQLSFF